MAMREDSAPSGQPSLSTVTFQTQPPSNHSNLPDAISLPGERYPETRTKFLTVGDIQNWNDDKLRYAINEMYARRGADFRDKDIKKWFQRFAWYHPSPGASYEDVERDFTDIEKRNQDLLGAYRNTRKGFASTPPVSSLKPLLKTFPLQNNSQNITPKRGGALHERTRNLDNL